MRVAIESGADQAARILGASRAEFFREQIESRIPGNLLPARIDADSLLGVGANERR